MADAAATQSAAVLLLQLIAIEAKSIHEWRMRGLDVAFRVDAGRLNPIRSHVRSAKHSSLPRKPEMKRCNTNSDIEARLPAERYRLQCDSPV